jgi:RecA-family ATPase
LNRQIQHAIHLAREVHRRIHTAIVFCHATAATKSKGLTIHTKSSGGRLSAVNGLEVHHEKDAG